MADFEWLAPGGHKRLVDNVVGLLADKPDSDALSPLLTAGAALGITGNDAEESAWLARTSEADGVASVRSIHGRTLRWNQKISDTVTWSGIHGTATTSDGVVTLTGSEDTPYINRYVTLVAGHKYLTSYEFYPEAGMTATVAGVGGVNTARVENPTANIWTKTAGIITATSSGSLAISLYATYGSGNNNGKVTKFRNIMFFDLTTMFGAGSEPTVAEFEAMYHDPYYPYDAGSLLPVNMEGIEAEDANGDPLAERTIPAVTLRGAGSVYDEQTATERITRVGEVDLGSLTWTYDSSYPTPFFHAPLAGLNMQPNSADMVSALYTAKSGFWGTAGNDMCIAAGGAYLNVSNAAYTDAAAFKTAMSGVMLHYAIATPTTTPIDPPLNMTYRTAQGGVERIMVPTGELSAPPTIVAAQGYTAESLRDAALATIAPIENGKASTNYGVGSYLVHGGQLCKVTTAIASGESITIGTNVTATTVMAEVIALTQ